MSFRRRVSRRQPDANESGLDLKAVRPEQLFNYDECQAHREFGTANEQESVFDNLWVWVIIALLPTGLSYLYLLYFSDGGLNCLYLLYFSQG